MDRRSCLIDRRAAAAAYAKDQHVESDANARAVALEGNCVVVEVRREEQHQTFLGPDGRVRGCDDEVQLRGREKAIQPAKEYGRRIPSDPYAYTLQSIAFDFASDDESSGSAIRSLRELHPTFTLKDFVSHEPYRDPKDLDRVVMAARTAGYRLAPRC